MGETNSLPPRGAHDPRAGKCVHFNLVNILTTPVVLCQTLQHLNMDSQTPVLHPWTDGETEAGWCLPAAELWSWDSDTAGWSRLRTPRRQGWAVKVNDAEIIQSYFSSTLVLGPVSELQLQPLSVPMAMTPTTYSAPQAVDSAGRAGVDGSA